MSPTGSFCPTEQQFARFLKKVSGSSHGDDARFERAVASLLCNQRHAGLSSCGAQPARSRPSPTAARDAAADGNDTVGLLLVAANRSYRESLARDLRERGFAVRSFADGAVLLESLNGAIDAPGDAGVILLDWNLPGASGIDLLPELRRRGVDLPVVFLARRAHADHESLAFDRGALDFIDKARGVEVLARRLRRVAEVAKRSAAPRADEPVVRGRLVLQPKSSRAYWDEVDVGLTLGEYNVVHLLASTAGRHVTYRAIYDRMHYEGFIAGSGEDGYRANVRSAIKRIRRKFRERDAAFAEIENYTAFGYCWRKPGGGR